MIVLVVDDDRAVHELVSGLLDRLEPTPEVDYADDCRTALEIVGVRNVDCVLLDQRLIESRGTECVEKLREQMYAGAVLMLTGHDDKEVILAALRNGADDYILKDDLAQELIPAIEKALTKRYQSIKADHTAAVINAKLQSIAEELSKCAANINHYLRTRDLQGHG